MTYIAARPLLLPVRCETMELKRWVAMIVCSGKSYGKKIVEEVIDLKK